MPPYSPVAAILHARAMLPEVAPDLHVRAFCPLVDVATLTHGAVLALGPRMAALFGDAQGGTGFGVQLLTPLFSAVSPA
ncbi:hypothetical protein [Actinoplanes couchii]|uniref:AraC family transcriptional regulator n=1 Tax=Actinoplanes couchii TaxID=403638 RepID=A0ABQ3XLC2_9ACTN|nr:hypothetical protein [Actinoplanes couchii]MDR6318322.1 hypothetical protein [Actinoplanes couchii]GID59309.1 hypothetical protein Aco03nite_077130 [Actinoplanes couchii]